MIVQPFVTTYPWKSAHTIRERRLIPIPRGAVMAKGHECPKCRKYTLQPYTTNQLKCTNCDTVVKKDQL